MVALDQGMIQQLGFSCVFNHGVWSMSVANYRGKFGVIQEQDRRECRLLLEPQGRGRSTFPAEYLVPDLGGRA